MIMRIGGIQALTEAINSLTLTLQFGLISGAVLPIAGCVVALCWKYLKNRSSKRSTDVTEL